MTEADYIDSYMKEINIFPLLEPKEERKLASIIRKYATGKRKQIAREKFINANLRLAVNLAKSFYAHFNFITNISFMDYVGAANEGLARAVDHFNPKKYKTRFSTYAYPWIKVHLLRLLQSYDNNIYIPPHIIGKLSRYKSLLKEDEDVEDQKLFRKLKVS